MLTIPANPGFALLIGAALALAAPKTLRGWIMAGAPLACLALMFWNPFGDYAGFNQVGLEVVQVRLDELSQMFGLMFATCALLVGAAAGQRRDRFEDAAILLMAGGATTAVFSGDLIGFIAASELSAIAGAWIVFSSASGRAAFDAGVRMLIWQGLGGLLLLCGVAFHLADGFRNVFTPLPADSIGGAFFLAGLAIKVGAPLAHVWVKDALSHASPAGAAALSIFSVKLALYALARGYAGEALLSPAGAALAILGALYALAADDLRRALAYSLLAQVGLAIAAIGAGTPLGVAAAAAHAFTTSFTYLVLLLAAGAVLLRTGTARASELGGLAQDMPITALFCIVAGVAAAGAPFLAMHVSQTLALSAVGSETWTGIALWASGAATAAFTAVRLPGVMFFGARKGQPTIDAPYPLLLPMAVALFVIGAVGVAPGWLASISPPAPDAPDPLAFKEISRRFEFVLAAVAAYGLLAAFGLGAERRPRRILDIDAFYRGPAATAATWTGRGILRLYEDAKRLTDAGFRVLERVVVAAARASDHPNASHALSAAGSLVALFCLLIVLYVLGT